MEDFLLSKNYKVGVQIGRGGFATVFEGRNLTTGEHVAVKVIDKAYVRRYELTGRVEQEIRIHSRLNHPSVVKLLDWFEDANYVYLILELCENGELQKYLKARGRPFEEPEGREIMHQVVDGFIYLHSQGIIHRDLSLANLLITKDMKLKICDFGLAKQLTRPDERHLTLCGTPNFISPEVATRSSHGLEADVWGLGILLYTLLVGRPPFETEGVKSTLTKVVMTDYTIPSHLSYEAKDLISKLLKKVPQERMRLNEIKYHPFMQSKQRSGKGSFASNDSGVYTMTTVSDSSRNNLAEGQHYRRLERDFIQHPLQTLERQPFRRSQSASSKGREPLAPIRESQSRQQSFDEKCRGSSQDIGVAYSDDRSLNSRRNHGFDEKARGSAQDLNTIGSERLASSKRASGLGLDKHCSSSNDYVVVNNDRLPNSKQTSGSDFSENHRGFEHGYEDAASSERVLNHRQIPEMAFDEKCRLSAQSCADVRDDILPNSRHSEEFQRTTGDDRFPNSHKPDGGFFRTSSDREPQIMNCRLSDHSEFSGENLKRTESRDRLFLRGKEYLRPRSVSSEEAYDENRVRSRSSEKLFDSANELKNPTYKADNSFHLPSQERRNEYKFLPRAKSGEVLVGRVNALTSPSHQCDPLRSEYNRDLQQQANSHLSCPSDFPALGNRRTECSHVLSCPSACAHYSTCACHLRPHSVDRVWHAAGVSVTSNHSAPAAVDSPCHRDLKGASPQLYRQSSNILKNRETSNVLNEGMQTPPLSTVRLKPTRQRTKNVVMQILENGEVCLEFIKDRKGLERVVDVCRISSDGLRVVIYHPNGSRGIHVSDTPPPIPIGGADFIYSYENLPSRFWKKYEYASRFVQLVKAKTPKVTFYSSLAKCCLMENSPNNDFEVNFYSGARIVKSQSGVALTEPGHASKLLPVNDPSKLSGETCHLYEHYTECHEKCLRYETLLEQIASAAPDMPLFPVIFGRKPSQSSGNLRTVDNKENLSPVTSSGIPSTVNMPSFGTTSSRASVRKSSRPEKKQMGRTKGINDVSVLAGFTGGTVKRADVPGLGRILELENGEIDVCFLDRYEMTISPYTAAIKVHRPSDPEPIKYPPNSHLPDDVEHRLSLVPKFLEHLKRLPPGIR